MQIIFNNARPLARLAYAVSASALALAVGCGDDSSDTAAGAGAGGDNAGSGGDGAGVGGDGAGGDGGDTPDVPSTYAFESRFVAGESSVAYGGQILRHVLIADLDAFISGLGDAIDGGAFPAMSEPSRFVDALDAFYRFKTKGVLTDPIALESGEALQTSYEDLSSEAKELFEKIAGQDAEVEHQPWNEPGEFVGWSDATVFASASDPSTPDGLVRALFQTLAENAAARSRGEQATGPGGEDLPVYVTPDGLDLEQLIQKFLLVAVAYSQGTDDYLDSDVDGSGLLSPNERDGDAPHTVLEHGWDEAFGYFGAARDYGDYEDAQVAAGESIDTDGDAKIDLLSEYNFGASVNAAKRDGASAESARTDFTADAWDGFLTGRAIIAAADGALSSTQMKALEAARDKAVLAWEEAIASTIVHYINETLVATAAIGTDGYDFAEHAKGWSEMKGFALGLQFNPRSRIGAADFAKLHDLLGDRPVIEGGDLDGYAADLRTARTLLADAYSFDSANVGDDAGQNGW